MPASIEQMRLVYDHIWTKGEAVTQDLSGVEILHSSLATLAELCVVITRDEYRRIWEYLLSEIRSPSPYRAEEKHSLVLTGQPGIGKTLFLYYALGAALKNHLPVVFCHSRSFLWVCDGDGAREVVYGAKGTDFALPRNCLYLVDLNYDLQSPPQIFVGKGGVCVVAVSTESLWWKHWAKGSKAIFWILPPCTPTELRELQRVYEKVGKAKWVNPPSDTPVYTPCEVSNYLGPSARVCMKMAGKVKSDRGPFHDLLSGREPDIVFPRVRDFSQLVKGRIAPGGQGDGFHTYFYVFAANENPSDECVVRLVVPTLFLRRTLSTYLRSLSLNDHLRAADLVSTVPHARGFYYESIVLEILQQTQGQGHTCQLEDSTSFTIKSGLTLCDVALDFDEAAPPIPLVDNCIYVTPPGYPGVDAVVVTENLRRITLFQFTTAKAHGLNPVGLPALLKTFQRALSLKRIRKYKLTFIFVAPNERAMNMAMSRANRRDLDTVDSGIKLGWLTLRSDNATTAQLMDAFEKELPPCENTGVVVNMCDERDNKPEEDSEAEDDEPKSNTRAAAPTKGKIRMASAPASKGKEREAAGRNRGQSKLVTQIQPERRITRSCTKKT